MMLESSPGQIRVLRVLHRREAYRKSARISQDVPGTEDLDAGEMPESDGVAAGSAS